MVKLGRRWLIFVALVLIACLGFNVAAATAAAAPAVAATPGWPLLDEVRELAEENYVNPVNEAALEEGAVRGMLECLGDPYNEYIPPGQVSQYTASLGDEYIGVGVVLTIIEGQVVVSSVIPNSPAARQGLRAGSILLAVDDRPLKGLSLEEVAGLLRGESGSSVELTVSLPGSGVQKKFLLVREQIRPAILNKRILAGQIGYLELKAFPKWVPQEVAAALEFLEAQGCRGLILDLRNNPGGYLESALEIASLFLIEGKPVVQVVGRDRQVKVIHSRGPGQDLPLVVLVDRGTASAAEILAGALQANQAAILLGTTTFGKGVIQTVFPLKNGGALKLTTDYYYTPAGRAIQGAGLKPDIEVDGEQQQLERAWNILSKQLSQPLPGSLALAGKE